MTQSRVIQTVVLRQTWFSSLLDYYKRCVLENIKTEISNLLTVLQLCIHNALMCELLDNVVVNNKCQEHNDG